MARRGLIALVAAALAGCTTPVPGSVSEGCRPPSALTDRDDDLSVLGELCASETVFSENGVTWTVQTFDSGRRGPLFVLPHDDEDAALAAAAHGLSRYGGAATAVETGGRRFNGGIDPNRNFDAGPLDCGRPGGRSPRFVEAMTRPGGRPVVALHSNAPGAAATGGRGSVSINAPYAGATAFPARGGSGALGGADAMVILASRNGARDGRVRRLAERLNAAGVNVLVETVDTARTDCSLSHYAVARGMPYANVEVRHGDAATQKRLLDILMAAI